MDQAQAGYGFAAEGARVLVATGDEDAVAGAINKDSANKKRFSLLL